MADKQDLNDMVGILEKIKQANESYNKSLKDGVKLARERLDVFEDLAKLDQKIASGKKLTKVEEEKLVKLGRERVNIQEEVLEKEEAIAKASKETAEAQEDAVKAGNNLGNALDVASEGAGNLKGMFKAGAKDIRGTAKSAGAWAERMQTVSSKFKQVPGAMGVAAKAAGLFGGVVGGISKAFLGWPGLILMGVKMLVDAAIKYDNWIKGLNKDFAMVRGPDVMTGDVAKQMRDFNAAIFDITDNIRDGMNSKDVKTFTDSLYQAGTHLSKIANGMTNLRDATFVAAKAGAAFGMEITQTGALMSEMMTDQRMSLKKVDDAFVQLSFDAQKSGMTTDRFFNAVNNATASLSVYGVFIKGMSKTLTEFQKSRAAGTADITDAFQAMTSAYKGMDSAAKAGFLAQVKPDDLKNMWIDAAEKFGESLKEAEKTQKDIQNKIDKKNRAREAAEKAGNLDKVKALNDEIRLLEEARRQTEMDVASAKKALVEIEDAKTAPAGSLKTGIAGGYLTDRIQDMVASALEQVKGVNLTKFSATQGESGIVELQSILKGIKVDLNDEQVRILIDTYSKAAVQTQNSLDTFTKGVTKNTGNKVLEATLTELGETLKTEKATTAAAMDDKTIEKFSALFGNETGRTKTLLEAAAANEELKKAMQAYMVAVKGKKDEKTLDQMRKNLDAIVLSSNHGVKMSKWNKRFQKEATAEQEDQYTKNFEAIRDGTLTFEKMGQITKEGFEWGASQYLKLDSMDKSLTSIATKYLGTSEKSQAIETLNKRGLYMSSEEKIATKTAGSAAVPAVQKRDEALATLKRLEAVDKELSLDEQKAYDAEEAKAQTDLADAQETIDLLKKVDESSEKMATLMADKNLTKDSKKMAELYSMMKKSLAKAGVEKADRWQLVQAVGDDLASVMMEYAQSIGEAPKASFFTSPTIKTEGTTTQTKQGLQKPEIVTHAGSVVLHPNETILPASLGNFQAKTWMMEAKAGGVDAGGNKSNINIQINASDYVLAGRLEKAIRNTVRGVLYNDQVNSYTG